MERINKPNYEKNGTVIQLIKLSYKNGENRLKMRFIQQRSNKNVLQKKYTS